MMRASILVLLLVHTATCSFTVTVSSGERADQYSARPNSEIIENFTLQETRSVEAKSATTATSFTSAANTFDLTKSDPKEASAFLVGLAAEDHVFQSEDKEPTLDEVTKSCSRQHKSQAPELKSIIGSLFMRGSQKKKTVHNLHPKDITTVLALGDSISAGFGLKTNPLLSGLLEYRGAAFSMGGDSDAVSFPNILDKNTDHIVAGRSKKWSLPLDALSIKNKLIRPHNPETDVLNGAQSGADSGLLQKQIDYLAEESARRKVDIENDWKVLTLFIGANDMCRVCNKASVDAAVEEYKKNVKDALERLSKEFPKTFVNLVQPLDVTQVHSFMGGKTYCKYVWRYLAECDCILGSEATEKTRADSQEFWKRINTFLAEEANAWKAKKSEDFTVVMQPFFSGARISEENQLSRIDCFHPSAHTQAALAVNLWNSMLTKQADKVTAMNPVIPEPICVTEDTILRTD